MTPIILIIVGLLIITLAIYAHREAKKHGTSTAEEFVGICTVAADRTVRKQANMGKILALLTEKPELSNFEVREALQVSSRTAVRYMDELERLGRVEQMGKIGHAVTYRLK